MFTVTYIRADGTTYNVTFDRQGRTKLALHLATAQETISSVYEQASPINHAIRKTMQSYEGVLTFSKAGRAYMEHGVALATSPQ